MTRVLARPGGPPGTDRDRPDEATLARHFSFRPTLEFKGQRFKGLQAFSGKPLHPSAVAHPELSEAAVLAGRLRS